MHEAAHERVERGGRADIDAGKCGDKESTSKRCIERVVHFRVDFGQPPAERRGPVSADRPKCSSCTPNILSEGARLAAASAQRGKQMKRVYIHTRSDVAADASEEGRDKSNNQQTKRSSSGSSGLSVDLGERESVGIHHDHVQVVNGIENGDHVEQGGHEPYGHLRQNRLRDIAAGVRNLLGKMRRAVRSADTVPSWVS